MNAILKSIIMATIAFVVIFYIDEKIKSYDMSFYQGKDDGLSARASSVIFLSSLLFLVYAKHHRLRSGLIGALVGFISSILGFILSYLVFNEYGLTFHIVSLSLSILVFILLRHLKHPKIDI